MRAPKTKYDLTKPFQVPTRRGGGVAKPPSFRRAKTQVQPEGPGVIQGKSATAPEVNFYIVATEWPDLEWIQFKATYLAQRFIPGRVELDFAMSISSILYPVFIDGLYWHRTNEQHEDDREETDTINRVLSGTGAYPAQRVPEDHCMPIERLRQETFIRVLQGYYINHFV